MNFIVELLAKLGGNMANAGTQGCWVWIMDESKMPKCLIEK